MNKRYRLHLSTDERIELEALVSKGKVAARKLTHAHILLLCDEGEAGPGWKDADICLALSVSEDTVARVRQRAAEEGPQAALDRKPWSRVYLNKLDGEAEAHLIATACSSPPQGRSRWTLSLDALAGRSRWTLSLLADRLVAIGVVESIGRETVRQTLKKTRLSRTCVSAG